MADTETAPTPVDGQDADGRHGWQISSLPVLTVLLLLVAALQAPLSRALSAPVVQSWMTVFVAVVTQAMPFLVLGVLLSAVIAVFVPPAFFTRALPRQPALAVPVAGLAGLVLPGCAAGVPRRRADDRPEAVRDAGSHVRPRLRAAVRAGDVRRRGPGFRRGRGGAAVTVVPR